MERINGLFQLKEIIYDWAHKFDIRVETISWENIRVATITLSLCQILWLEPMEALKEKFKFVGVDAQDGAVRIIVIFSD